MKLSDGFANLSQVFWLFAQLPQIWKNYNGKSVDGLSLPFLLNWLCGDLMNLVGCILTNQLPFQRNLAIYFTVVDLVLLYQYAVYTEIPSSDYQPMGGRVSMESDGPDDRWPRRLCQASAIDFERPQSGTPEYSRSISRLGRKRSAGRTLRTSHDSLLSEEAQINGEPPLPPASPLTPAQRGRSPVRSTPALTPESLPGHSGSLTAAPAVFLGAFAFLAWSRGLPSGERSQSSAMPQAWAGPATRASATDGLGHDGASAPTGSDWREAVGQVSAWVCAVLYLTSRLPQIWKNHRRQSVVGLSMLLFAMAFLGNLAYVASVLSAPEAAHPGYVSQAAPFLIGSGGTLCFDFTIFVQSRLYRNRAPRSQSASFRQSQYRTDSLEAEEAAALLTPDPTANHASKPSHSRASARSISMEPAPPHSLPSTPPL